MKRETTHWGTNLIPWNSLPKWVYGQRLSDDIKDRPNWYTDTNRINNFEIRIRPLEGDPKIKEYEDGVVEIYAYSKKGLLKVLRHYKETFEVLEEGDINEG